MKPQQEMRAAEILARRDRIKVELVERRVRTKDVCYSHRDRTTEVRKSAVIFIDDEEVASLNGAGCEQQAKSIVEFIVNSKTDLRAAMHTCVADRLPEKKRTPKAKSTK